MIWNPQFEKHCLRNTVFNIIGITQPRWGAETWKFTEHRDREKRDPASISRERNHCLKSFIWFPLAGYDRSSSPHTQRRSVERKKCHLSCFMKLKLYLNSMILLYLHFKLLLIDRLLLEFRIQKNWELT